MKKGVLRCAFSLMLFFCFIGTVYSEYPDVNSEIIDNIEMAGEVSDDEAVLADTVADEDGESEVLTAVKDVEFLSLDFNPTDFKEDTQMEFFVSVQLNKKENVEIDTVSAGLSALMNELQELEYNEETGAWENNILLPNEYVESGLLMAKAVMKTNEFYPESLEFSTNARIYPGYFTNARNNARWRGVFDFMLICGYLALGMFLKRKIKFLQKYLIPPSMLAGFIGLALKLIAEWLRIKYNTELFTFLEFSPERLGNMVYHLMAIGFISIALQDKPKKEGHKGDPVNTGVTVILYYLIQGIFGFAITLFLAYTFLPDLFPPFGLLLPLGFGQGPGQAYSIGSSWEEIGFLYGGNIGLTIATFGFLWACFGGVPLMNILVRKGKFKPASSVYGKSAKEARKITSELVKEKEGDVPLSESVDRLTIQMFLIGISYLMTYGGISLLNWIFALIAKAAPGSETLMSTLGSLMWGFNFLFGALCAMIVKKSMGLFKNFEWMHRNYPNNYILQRLGGTAFDFMIAAAIIAISIPVLFHYAVPILILVVLGGVIHMIFVIFIGKRYFKKFALEYILAFFGMGTGTISTGLVLLKEVDPTFETPAAKDMVFGSGVALPLGLPLMAILSIPVLGYVNNDPSKYWLTFVLFFIMLIALLAILVVREKKKQGSKPKKKKKK